MRIVEKSWTGMPSWHCYYATPLAKQYHRAECPKEQDTIPVTYAQARERHLTPCKLCKPIPMIT